MAKQLVTIEVDVPEGKQIDGAPFPIHSESGNMVGYYVMFKPAVNVALEPAEGEG